MSTRLGRAFTIFHLVLGLTLLWGSVQTVLHHAGGDLHALIIGSVEALGAIAFLVPRTLQIGAILLLGTLGLAVLIHAARGEWRPDLLVYAAGVVLVSANRSAAQVPAGRGAPDVL